MAARSRRDRVARAPSMEPSRRSLDTHDLAGTQHHIDFTPDVLSEGRDLGLVQCELIGERSLVRRLATRVFERENRPPVIPVHVGPAKGRHERTSVDIATYDR